MGAVLLGVILLILKWLLAFPPSVELLLLVVGLVLIVIGLYRMYQTRGVDGRSRLW